MTMDKILNITLKNFAHKLLEKIPNTPGALLGGSLLGGSALKESTVALYGERMINMLLESLMAKTVKKIIIRALRYFRQSIENMEMNRTSLCHQQEKEHELTIKFIKMTRFCILFRMLRILDQLKRLESQYQKQ